MGLTEREPLRSCDFGHQSPWVPVKWLPFSFFSDSLDSKKENEDSGVRNKHFKDLNQRSTDKTVRQNYLQKEFENPPDV